SPATFNGSPQAATVTGSVPGTASNVKYGGSATVPTNAGTYAITADFIPTDTTHYNSLTGTSAGNFVISQVSSVTTVSCPTSVTYNAAPQAPCSVTVTGASLSLTPAPTYSNQTSAGTATASYAYTGDTNHTGSSDSKNFTISKANASCAIAGYSATYTASANTATGSCTGVGSDGTLSGLDLSGTTHISAGDYPTDPWTFTAPNSNYNNDSGMVHDSIGKANANCSSITGSSGTYDGTSHGASGSCLGLGSDGTLAGLDLGSSFTDVPGGTAHWVFTDATGNYNNNSGDASIVINPADATCSISGYTGIYDGSAHGASGTCTGVTDEDLTSDVDFGAMYTSVPGGFADWTFHDPAGNYDDQGETVTIDISKATPTATLAVNNSPATYDGSTHAATVGVTTSSTPGSAQNILTGTVSNQTNAGTYAVTANFVPSDSTDYNTLTGLSAGNFIIAKANPASCSVKGYVALYDGHAHSVQQTDASCAGVAGAIGGSFDLSNTTHIAGGSYSDPWTFHSSDANYNDTTGRVNDVIIAAQPPITIAKKDFQNGSTIPIKIPSGTSGWAISLNVCNVTGTVCNPAISSGGSNVGTQFRFDSTGQQYIYNLSTKNTNGFVAGSSYTLRISSTGNPFSGNFNLGTLTIKSN
ncbi:MAG: MBG domain-containing protein, partial [Minisyncoccia bacterium]